MQSRAFVNLGLFVAVTALAAFAWLSQHNKNKVQYLSALDITQVNSIVIPRSQGEIILTRTGDNWQMQQPFALPAHAFRIQTLLGLLQTPVTQSYETSELDLTQFGLDPARASIRFNDTEIKFGKSNPVNLKRYIQADNKIYLVNDTLYPLVSAEAASFVDLSLLAPGARITQLELPNLFLAQNSDQLWYDKTGKTVAADSVQQLLDYWRDSSAFGAHAYLKRERAKLVRFEFADGKKSSLWVLRENDWLIIGNPDAGIEYHLDPQLADKLLKLPVAAVSANK